MEVYYVYWRKDWNNVLSRGKLGARRGERPRELRTLPERLGDVKRFILALYVLVTTTLYAVLGPAYSVSTMNPRWNNDAVC